MECAGHVASFAPYVSICEYVASDKLRRLSGSSSSDIGLSASQIMSSIGEGASDVNGISSSNSVGKDKTMMFKTCSDPFANLPALV